MHVDVRHCTPEVRAMLDEDRFFIGVTLLACGARTITDENMRELALRAMIVNDGVRPYDYWLGLMREWRGVTVNGVDETPLAWYARLLTRIAPNALNCEEAVAANVSAVYAWAENQGFDEEVATPE